jgi:hypothetical protein
LEQVLLEQFIVLIGIDRRSRRLICCDLGNLKKIKLPLEDLDNQDIPMCETDNISETQEDSDSQASKKNAPVA